MSPKGYTRPRHTFTDSVPFELMNIHLSVAPIIYHIIAKKSMIKRKKRKLMVVSETQKISQSDTDCEVKLLYSVFSELFFHSLLLGKDSLSQTQGNGSDLQKLIILDEFHTLLKGEGYGRNKTQSIVGA